MSYPTLSSDAKFPRIQRLSYHPLRRLSFVEENDICPRGHVTRVILASNCWIHADSKWCFWIQTENTADSILMSEI